MKTLSPTQQDVVAKMRAAGGRIERWPGGFWTTPGTAFTMSHGGGLGSYKVPDWWIGVRTLYALEKAGLITQSKQENARGNGRPFAVEYRLVS